MRGRTLLLWGGRSEAAMGEAALRNFTSYDRSRARQKMRHSGAEKHMIQAARVRFGEQAMRADAKRRRKRDDADRDERERRRRQEEALDDALMNTFPASDPVSAEQPARAS
jgi:hypothetical protein